MFEKEVYIKRRSQLKSEIKSGIALFLGNVDTAFNYPANLYSFRQDSQFLYFFGLKNPGFAGIIDFDNNSEYIFGNDFDIDDVIWMGVQPKVSELAAKVGVHKTGQYKDMIDLILKAKNESRKIDFLPAYRGETIIELSTLLGISINDVKKHASERLIKAVIKIKEIKSEEEIKEIEKAVDIAYEMHTTSMRMATPGRIEQEIAGTIEGISLALGGPVSFPIILSQDGQTLHNHHHDNILEVGRMMVTDAGAETQECYSSDITRTVPVGGKFNKRQAEIYQIVLDANLAAINAVEAGTKFKTIHFIAAKVIIEGLIKLGLMKGDSDKALEAEAHTLFMPHGLGHMMGMDVHDMEGLGENYVGYDEKTERETSFGTAYLRLGKELKSGFVITIEPGIYFIPELIDKFRKENKFNDFINYDKVETYKDFGGIRIEDDVLVTENGFRVLGKPIPKAIEEVEAVMANPL